MTDHLARPARPARTSPLVQAFRALYLDFLVVLVFAAAGRSTHDESVDVPGILETAWPFLVSVVLSSLALAALRRPLTIWPVGVGVWGGTWALGMGLRALTGGGTALPFVLVALGTLGAGILGWRLIARFIPAVRRAFGGTPA